VARGKTKAGEILSETQYALVTKGGKGREGEVYREKGDQGKEPEDIGSVGFKGRNFFRLQIKTRESVNRGRRGNQKGGDRKTPSLGGVVASP